MKRIAPLLQQIRQQQIRNYAKKPITDASNYVPKPYTGPSKEEVLATRKQYLNPGIFLYYKNPIMIVEGKQQYLFDETGKRYLDCFAGIVTVSVGHCHPEIVKAGQKQLETIMHTTTIYANPEIAMFAKELADKLPGNLKCIYFTNSGSEANDLAMLMARTYTGNDDFLALRNAYHGMSYGTMGLTALHTWKYNVPHGHGIKHVLNPDLYRGHFTKEDPKAVQKYINDVKSVIEHTTSGQIAGFIAEPIQGVGGAVTMPDGYLKGVYEIVRKHGGICVADEVQTGFGRCGTHYWGFEANGVMPDMVTMAKGIGNGIPLAAVATTPEIAATIAKRIHFNTYGGNPVSCAVGRAVLRVIDEEGIQENALHVGNYLKEQLLQLQKKYPQQIGEVRGKGLMIGMEVVKDAESKEPNAPLVANIFEYAKDNGVLVGKGGLYGNVFRIKPPMCFNKANVDQLVTVLDQGFAKFK